MWERREKKRKKLHMILSVLSLRTELYTDARVNSL